MEHYVTEVEKWILSVVVARLSEWLTESERSKLLKLIRGKFGKCWSLRDGLDSVKWVQKQEFMMEKIVKKSFCVIGKLGSTDDGDGFIQRLWQEANSNFDEVKSLADCNEDGSLKGIWGAMSAKDFSFMPWTENFTCGYYLAGIECQTDAYPPKGWKKWVVPGFEALKVMVTGDDTFRNTLAYMKENGIELAGAVHDFTDPATGVNYMIFPTKLDFDSKRELIKSVKDRSEKFAPCGFYCLYCSFSEWCGNCLSSCNTCSYAMLSDDNMCENVKCSRGKGLKACAQCSELEECKKGFFKEPYGCFAKASSLFRRKYGEEEYLRASEACTGEEKKYLREVQANPNDDKDVWDKINSILKILEDKK